jgi:hypothetical protein
MNRLNRAYIGASAAVGAYFGINLIDITFRNRFHRTFVNAGATSSAIVIYYISHDY